jgi:hypothetical protein
MELRCEVDPVTSIWLACACMDGAHAADSANRLCGRAPQVSFHFRGRFRTCSIWMTLECLKRSGA